MFFFLGTLLLFRWSNGYWQFDLWFPNTVHGILQTRILEWVAIHFSRGASQPRDWTQVSRIAGRFFTIWATRGAPNFPKMAHAGKCYLRWSLRVWGQRAVTTGIRGYSARRCEQRCTTDAENTLCIQVPCCRRLWFHWIYNKRQS